MIQERHPAVAFDLIVQLGGRPQISVFRVAAASLRSLTGVVDFEPPQWWALAGGAGPPPPEPDDVDPET